MLTPLGQRIIVRYARKPFWMPTANSKLFRIPEHTFYSDDEIKQIVLLHDAYKAQRKSIEEFMKIEFYIPATQSGGLPSSFIQKELEADKAILEENDQINARVAKEREEYFSQQMKDLETKLLQEKERIEHQLLQNAQEVDQHIQENLSDPDSFVTRENIESMIDKAMENPVTYEFYIDPRGKRYGSKYGVMSSRSK